MGRVIVWLVLSFLVLLSEIDITVYSGHLEHLLWVFDWLLWVIRQRYFGSDGIVGEFYVVI